MSRAKRNLWLAGTIVLAVLLTIVAFSYIVTEPWRILLDIGGDGAKNNLTYLFHSVSGKGYWFDGMNYPYGEHIVFTDGIPLLSVFFASIGNVSVSVALTTLWWLTGLSYVLCMVYVYKTLLRLQVASSFAMVFAACITFLSPQIFSLWGHYALSFACIVPMLFYWTLAYHINGHKKYCAYIFLLGVLSAFIHPYYAGMVLVWVGAYIVGYLVLNLKSVGSKALHLLFLLLAGAGVPAVVMTVLKLTDQIHDRPTTPYNPLDSYADILQIVSTWYSPFWRIIVDNNIWKRVSTGGEGYSYIGVVPLVVVLVSIFLLVFRRLKSKKEKVVPQSAQNSMSIWLFMAFSALIFSMGIPFIWNMLWLMDYLFIFKQFRALGRFAWIFYYIITVYAVYVMYGWYTALVADKKRIIAAVLFFLAAGAWAYEAKAYMKRTRKLAEEAAYNYDVIFSTHEQNWKSFLQEHSMSGQDFQAVLLLKYFHIGTEKIWVGDPGWLISLGSRAALQLHLPIVNVMMSRSSWQQAQKQVKLVAGPYASKPTLKDLPNNKPFLLLNYDLDSLAPDQKYLLAASDYLGEFSSCKIYACYPNRILANDESHAKVINSIVPFMGATDSCIGENEVINVIHFQNGGFEDGLFGSKAAPCIKGIDSVIASWAVPVIVDSQLYEFSAWFLLGKEDYKSPDVLLEMLDGSGRVVHTEKIPCSNSVDSYEMWFRASGYFYIPASCKEVRCKVANEKGDMYIAMDEFLLRQAKNTIISKLSNGTILVNNHLFKKGN